MGEPRPGAGLAAAPAAGEWAAAPAAGPALVAPRHLPGPTPSHSQRSMRHDSLLRSAAAGCRTVGTQSANEAGAHATRGERGCSASPAPRCAPVKGDPSVGPHFAHRARRLTNVLTGASLSSVA